MAVSFKFFSFKDFIFSVVPTAASYEGYLQDLVPMDLLANRYVELGMGVVLSGIFALLFYKDNVLSYKKSLAEILATGYFMNFTGRLGRLLQGKNPITFLFPNNREYEVLPQQIKVRVALPTSMAALRKHSHGINLESEVAYISQSTTNEPFWVRAVRKDDGTFTIFEYPRTLFALPRYLQKEFSDPKKSEKSSKKLFKYFNAKIENSRIANIQDLPEKQFVFDYV
ncbi:MAG: hypothetical protein KJO20_12520 [Eudoraea sp.]|nr:hypothetical protein [Eudoraea sp.]NNK31263.1 hypothetical protein [Flavobacteriaceae bacterium]